MTTAYQPPEGYLTLTEARERLGISKTTMHQRVRTGLLTTYRDQRDRRTRLVKVEDVERMAQPMPTPPVRIADQGQPSGKEE
jgi:excisionase family DNA binding protein